MATAVITVASGGLPVTDVTATAPLRGMAVTEALNGCGIAVTKGAGGLPVTFVLAGNEWPSGGGGGTAYATWDPATVTAVTLSGGNLVATSTGTTSADQGAKVATASGKTSGKYYFEMTWTTLIGPAGGNRAVGVGTTASTYTGMGNGGTTGIHHYMGSTTWSNGSQIASFAGAWTSGQIVGIAVDLDNRKFWVKNTATGIWNNNGANDPTTNVGGLTIPAGTMVPFVTFGGTNGAPNNVFTANFGASAFNGAVPSGFTSGWPSGGDGGGATAYTTFDTATLNFMTLSADKLTATKTLAGSNAGARSIDFKDTGKYYFEIYVTTIAVTDYNGILSSTGTYADLTGSTAKNAFAVIGNGVGNIWSNQVNTSKTIGSPSTGSTICFAIDLTTRVGWARRNSGLWNGTAGNDPATGVGGLAITTGSFAPVFGVFTTNGGSVTANFGASAFAFAVPAGFTSGWPA